MHVNVIMGVQLDEHLLLWQPAISIILYVIALCLLNCYLRCKYNMTMMILRESYTEYIEKKKKSIVTIMHMIRSQSYRFCKLITAVEMLIPFSQTIVSSRSNVHNSDYTN